MSGQKPMSELYKTLARAKKQKEELNKKSVRDKLRENNPARKRIRESNYAGYMRENGRYFKPGSDLTRPEFSDRKYTREQLVDEANDLVMRNIFGKKKK